MNIKLHHILFLLIAAAIGFYLGKGQKEIQIKNIRDEVPVTVYLDSIEYKTDTVVLPQGPIDSASVVADYYQNRSFDTTVVVNEISLNLSGGVYQNRLRDLEFTAINFRPTKVYREYKWNVSAGLIAGPSIVAPTLSTGYKNHDFGVGYNLTGQQGLIFSYRYKFLEF